jgi:uncharacterized membrane protein YjgN (DUF898 family)
MNVFAIGVWLGLVTGIPAGMAVQYARIAVRNYHAARTELPGKKQTAANSESRGAVWILAVLGVAVAALLAAVRVAGQ